MTLRSKSALSYALPRGNETGPHFNRAELCGSSGANLMIGDVEQVRIAPILARFPCCVVSLSKPDNLR
jgi:hypothetical protein